MTRRYRPKGTGRVERTCQFCGGTFTTDACNVDIGWGKFCCRAHGFAWRSAQPSQKTPLRRRTLREGEAIPSGMPSRRRMSNGYIVLQWLVGAASYVQVYEHRLREGVVVPDNIDAHHKNRIRSDNRPENLEYLTRSEHMSLHHFPTFDVEEAKRLYAQGWSLKKLARHFGMSDTAIYTTLKKRGFVFRPRLGRGTKQDFSAYAVTNAELVARR